MSVCRYSIVSDVYVYDSGNFVIHVGERRHRLPDGVSIWYPTVRDILNNPEEALPQMAANTDLVKGQPLEAIGGPVDGQTFRVPTAQAALDQLLKLREMGYRIPDFALRSLAEDPAE